MIYSIKSSFIRKKQKNETKKQFWIVIVFMFLSFPSFSQLSLFDDIDLGPSNFYLTTLTSDWGRTHGNPYYGSGDLTAEHNYSTGEGDGFFRNYKFAENSDYIVEVLIPWFETWGNTSDDIEIRLANGITSVTSPTIPVYHSPIPSFGSSRLIYKYTGDRFLNRYVLLRFSTGLVENWSSIIFYPRQNNPAPHDDNLQICSISIKNCAKSTKYYDVALPTGIVNHRNVYIGSSYGSASLVSSATSPSTDVVATSQITVSDNTLLSVSQGNSLLLRITPCDYSFSEFPDLDEGEVDSMSQYILNVCDAHSFARKTSVSIPLQIFPNPNTGAFTITFPEVRDYTVTVSDIIGKIIHTLYTSKQEKQLINLQGVTPGIYYVIVTGDNQYREIKKIVIN